MVQMENKLLCVLHLIQSTPQGQLQSGRVKKKENRKVIHLLCRGDTRYYLCRTSVIRLMYIWCIWPPTLSPQYRARWEGGRTKVSVRMCVCIGHAPSFGISSLYMGLFQSCEATETSPTQVYQVRGMPCRYR